LVAAKNQALMREVERVLARADRYWIVEKKGVAAREAARLDPRTRPSARL